MPNISLLTLAATKGMIGVSAILLPSLTARLFFLPEFVTWAQLFGSRDAMAAGLLLTANTPEAIRTALWAGILTDTVDALAGGLAFLQGNLAWQPALYVGGGAFVLALVRLAGLRSLETVVPKVRAESSASSSNEPLL
ncbi:MAG: hypothetical protein M1829_005898 [Trizodia sp. TS-e1964]|nr:MAG: hypothetical protein M1829_005898 [Trizodia sp. TS-e1964]